jgi:hypothetical protein
MGDEVDTMRAALVAVADRIDQSRMPSRPSARRSRVSITICWHRRRPKCLDIELMELAVAGLGCS